MKRTSWICLLAGVLASLSASVADAQVGYHVLESKVKLGPWTFNPIVYVSDDGTASVESLLALVDTDAIVGDNIVAVWYNRQTDGSWEAKAWGASDDGTAVSYVAQSLQIPDEERSFWSVPGVYSDIDTIEPPADYSNGILLSDPLAPAVLYSADPDGIVEYLTSIGYKSADIPADKSNGCISVQRLNAVANAMNETLIGPPQTVLSRSANAFSSSCGSMSGAVIVTSPPVPTSPFTAPTYSCSLTSPFGSGVYLQCHRWTKTRALSQSRTLTCIIPGTPGTPAISLTCNQTRTGVETSTTECCQTYQFDQPRPPCPPAVPPSEPPVPGGSCLGSSGSPGTPTTTTETGGWSAWSPACSCVAQQ